MPDDLTDADHRRRELREEWDAIDWWLCQDGDRRLSRLEKCIGERRQEAIERELALEAMGVPR